MPLTLHSFPIPSPYLSRSPGKPVSTSELNRVLLLELVEVNVDFLLWCQFCDLPRRAILHFLLSKQLESWRQGIYKLSRGETLPGDAMVSGI